MNVVQVEKRGEEMNPKVSSREEILEMTKTMVTESGLGSVSIRSVAERCGIAVGSIYNYFPSKRELLVAVTEIVWRDIFDLSERRDEGLLPFVERVLRSLEAGAERYPNFFGLHFLAFGKEDSDFAKISMARFFDGVRTRFAEEARRDKTIPAERWSEDFTPEDLSDVILNLVLSMFIRPLSRRCVVEALKVVIGEEEKR